MTKTEVIRKIREFCIQCMGYQVNEVPLCTAPKCPLFDLRMGKDPTKSKSRVEAGKRSLLAQSTVQA